MIEPTQEGLAQSQLRFGFGENCESSKKGANPTDKTESSVSFPENLVPKETINYGEHSKEETNIFEKAQDLTNVYEDYEVPDRFINVEDGLFPSPFSHRTTQEEYGGKVEVWGNSCKIESNLNSHSDNKLWYRGINEYENVDGKIKKKSNRNYTPTRKKGDIKGFSKSSRRRLLKKVNKVDYKNRKMPYWITLTYPNRFPTDPEEYKADLDTFFKRMKRTFGEVEYLWKLEFQKRGAPHYHLIVFLPERNVKLTYLRKWISANWYAVAQRFWDEKDEKHLRAGTNCKEIENYRQLIAYVSKYLGKVDQQAETKTTGRVWGSSKNWGDHITNVVINGKGIAQFVRIIRKYIKSQGSVKMAKYMRKNPNTEIFIPHSVVTKALQWIEDY